MRHLILLIAAFSFAASSEAVAQTTPCDGQSYYDVVYVPVYYSFSDLDLQRADIYRSLDPKITYDEPVYEYERVAYPAEIEFEAVEGRVRFDFCLEVGAFRDDAGPLVFSVGMRPVPLEFGATQASETDEKVSLHAPVMFLDQDRPNWIIALDAMASETREGDIVLDVHLLNPTDRGLLGVDMDFVAHRPSNVACFMAGPNKYYDVEFEVASGAASADKIAVFASDPVIGDAIRVETEVTSNMCGGGDYLSVKLGNSGVLGADSSNLFRYKMTDLPLPPSYIEFSNGRVSPSSLRISGNVRVNGRIFDGLFDR